TRLTIDTDITKSLPVADPVIADSEYVMSHNPVKDRVVIDMGLDRNDPETLTAGAAMIESRLTASGLFSSVGMDEYQSIFPELVTSVTERLPALFTEHDLDRTIRPLLEPRKIKEALAEHYSRLLDLEGIGQSGMMADDPLGFKNVILARMAHLAPSRDIQIIQGRLISADGRHLLVIAEPKGSGTDTAQARKIASLIASCAYDLGKKFNPRGIGFTVTPVGAYRAALDNEETAKRDARRAVIFATIGIAVLLLVGFPRPVIGILALVPAVLGTIAAAFVYSLFARTISILAIGFGGTIISFTVDYGIAYLLFLDRPYETRGMDATREVWSLGLLAMLTTALSFALLFITGFSVLSQIGYFTALGVVFTYLFVHTLFPVIFPTMPPAKRTGFVPIQKFVNRIMRSNSRASAYGALFFCAVMLAFARPDFKVDLAAMNTVTRDTLRAEELISKVWGNVFSRLYLMTEARSLEDLQTAGDRLAGKLDSEISAGTLSTAFVPSMLFPGRERTRANLAAWNRFWTPARVAELKKSMRDASREIGFAPDAFERFYGLLARTHIRPHGIPDRFHRMLNIRRMRDSGEWAQFSVLTPGPKYRGERFHSTLSSAGLGKLFDPVLFSERLGSILLSGFIKMAAVIGAVTACVAVLYLLDVRLTLIALAPTLFSLICTLGTMKLLGQQPGIPTIIVVVIVIGMGTDYALYIVRAYQRYMEESHQSLGLIRMTVFLSALSTMIGFGVLGLADHALLKSVGMTLFMGISYSFIGTVMIVPPLLRTMFVPEDLPNDMVEPCSKEHAERVHRRYRFMEPYPRLFARFKLKFDPLFGELHQLVGSPATILDIGTGYGVPAVWLLELFPRARLYGIEPDAKRRRVASRAVGERGWIVQGSAPDLPDFPGTADAALLIDMIHYLPDRRLRLLLERVRKRMSPRGILVVRGTVPAAKRCAILRLMETLWIRMNGLTAHNRSEGEIIRLMRTAGFSVSVRES
ncbi:MAG: hypothetical protein A2176_00180, partial [Spirochaetes bacterium RBG_13_51_14]